MGKTQAIVSIEPIMVDMGAVVLLTGLSRSTIESLIRKNDFPRPRAASNRTSRWIPDEIKQWAASRPISDHLPPENGAEGGRNSKGKS